MEPLEHLEKRLDEIEGRLHSLETKSAVDEVHRVNVEKRLQSIENSLQWLVRLVLGAIISAVTIYAISGGLSV
jgi:hypothetical protein